MYSGLNERFNGPALDVRLRWLNPPPAWSLEPAGLMVRPAAETDFWQQTHYGFRADNGHFLYLEVAGDFSVTTKVRFHPAHLYDQAGLMVRVGPSCWIKTSVEYEAKGPCKLGAVVTNHGYSDWSLQDFPARAEAGATADSAGSPGLPGRMETRGGEELGVASRRASARGRRAADPVRLVCVQPERQRVPG